MGDTAPMLPSELEVHVSVLPVTSDPVSTQLYSAGSLIQRTEGLMVQVLIGYLLAEA